MAEHSRPWAVPAGTTDPALLAKRVLSEEQHRAFLGGVLGSGVINARTGTELNVLADGTSVLRLQPGEYLIDGIYYWNDAEKLFNVATIGAQPAVGQSRIDNLVMRLNPTDKEVTAELVTGVPSTNPANPALNRGSSHSGTYEDVIRSWRYTGQGLTQAEIDAGDRRSWLGPHLSLAAAASLYSNTVDLGTTARRRGVNWSRELVNGTPDWVDVDKAHRDAIAAARPVKRFARRPQDDDAQLVPNQGTVREGLVVQLSVPGAGRQIEVNASVRLSQSPGHGPGRVSVRALINGVEMGHEFGPVSVAEGQEVVWPFHAIATASANNPDVAIQLRAKTTSGVLNIRTGSHMVVTSS